MFQKYDYIFKGKTQRTNEGRKQEKNTYGQGKHTKCHSLIEQLSVIK